MEKLLCVDHLTVADEDEPAVTMLNGTALCRDCAKGRADRLQELADPGTAQMKKSRERFNEGLRKPRRIQ